MPNINKNIIMQAGAAVANATNKAAGLTVATPEPGSIISAIQLVNGGRVIGPTALAHFTESVRNKLLSLLVSVEPIQDFNGYGHPWPAGGGKNKLNPLATYKGCAYNAAVGTTLNPVAADKSWQDAGNDTFTISNLGSWSQACLISDPLPLGKAYVKISNVIGALKCTIYVCNGDFEVNRVLYNRNPVPEGDTIEVNTTFTNDDTYFVVYLGGNGADASIQYPYAYSGDTAATDSFTPYSNNCPISGRTGLDVYVSPTTAQADATTYSVDWTTRAGTVYGGTLDVVTGVLTVNLAMVDFGTLTWSKSSAIPSHFYASSTESAIPYKYSDSCYMICSNYKYDGPGNTTVGGYYGQNGTFRYYYAPTSPSSTTREFYITDEAKAALTAAEFKATMNGVQLVYELATPLAYQLSAQDVVTLVGFNYIWSDDGNVTITE